MNATNIDRIVLSLAGSIALASAAAASDAGSLSSAAAPFFQGRDVLYSRAVRLPLTGVDIQLFKVYDPTTGTTESIVTDDAFRPIDHEWLLAIEAELERQLFGNMHRELHARVTNSAPATPFDVLIKFSIAEERLDKTEIDRGLVSEAEFQLRAEAVQAAVEEKARELLSAAAGRYQFGLPQHAVMGPFVEITLPASALRELARDESIAFIGPVDEAQVEDAPTIAQSLPTTMTNSAHANATGTGVKIAVLESGQLSKPEACFRVAAKQTTSGSPNAHMTMSLGIIGNRYNGGCTGSWQGYAPDASVLMANAASYTSGYSWARAQGANVVTMSWHPISEETTGTLSSRDVFFDYWTTQGPFPLIVTSAGNQAATNAYASGKGFNFLGVGDVGNDGDGYRCDDVMTASSTWRDPICAHSDREVPAIAAPGSTHALLGGTFSGTSAATPVTASIAALVMSETPALKTWPEAVRAILLATADYQRADNLLYSNSLDGKDGAGMVNAYNAVLSMRTGGIEWDDGTNNHDYGNMFATSFPGGYFETTWVVDGRANLDKVRIALTWNSEASQSSSVLDADLDLHVFGPNGALVAYSTSYDSSVEFVEFVPPVTGPYTIKIKRHAAPSNFHSYYGLAWYVDIDC